MRTFKIILASFVAFVALSAIAFEYVVPIAIEHALRDRLGDGARFAVGDVALDRVELLDVTLARGLELGDVTIEAGPWHLWRGRSADVVLHGPRIASHALALDVPGGGKLPFDHVSIVDGKLDELAVAGTIDLRGRVDLTARAATMHVGRTVVRDVAATIRGPLAAVRACATGDAEGVHLDGCVVLDAAHRPIAITHGRVAATLDDRTLHGAAIDGATLHADLSGTLDAFAVRGELRATQVATAKLVLRDAVLPFELAGSYGDALQLRSARELVMTASSATVSAGDRTVRIHAPAVTARGSLAMLEIADDVPFQIVAHLRGVPVDHVLAVASGSRARGTGFLDGELVFDETLKLVGGSLAARTPGHLRIDALAQQGDTNIAVHRRVAAALADFDYSQLALSVKADPDFLLSLRGRGHRVPQELAVDVNVRIR